MYYDRNGKPMSLIEWAAKFEDNDYKQVSSDIANGVTISTVWLGLDHNFSGGMPLIFETMVFGGDSDQYCRRYSTLAQAIAGHAEIVAAVQRDEQLVSPPAPTVP